MNTLKLADIFQDNMVIQQNKPFKIWGIASPFKKIRIKADWLKKTVVTAADDQGNWQTIIRVPKVNQGDFFSHTICVIDDIDKITLSNIQIGEVWIAAGQSNMQYRMICEEGKNNGVINYEKEIAAANYPSIRLFYAGLSFKPQPYHESKGCWDICTPETIANFSGVAYYFIRELHVHLKLPVGIILCNIGASRSEAWTSRKVMEQDKILFYNYLKPFDDCLISKEELDDGFTFEKVTRPALLYNGMIHPLRHLSIKGFIWYHGELNRNDGSNYLRLLIAMIKGWRQDFEQGDLPFYLVQQPPYFWDNEDVTEYDYAIFRELQTKARQLKNVHMAVVMDDDEPRKLHPKNKKLVGVRLAKIALNRTYRFKNIEYLGPQLKKVLIKNDIISVYYKATSIKGGLTTSDGLPPKHFEIAGTDRVFLKANAIIEKKRILLKNENVKKPISVRYAFTNTAVTNLINASGLPAEPFRTDDWQKIKIITIANHKGGVGKSMLTLNLYNHFLAKKLNVVMVDVDNAWNGSITLLKNYHSHLNVIREADIQKIKKLSYDIILVDTPPTNSNGLFGLFSISDFVLIPIKMSLFDILALTPIIKQITDTQSRHTVKAGIVMNCVEKLSGDTKSIKNYLKEMPLRLMDTFIEKRLSFNRSPLTGGVIHSKDQRAIQQIDSLAQEIISIIG